MLFSFLLTAVCARFGPGYVTTTTTQDPNTPTCTVSETYIGVDESTHNAQFCPAYNKNCRNMYATTAEGGTECHYACTRYLSMHWCYTEDCAANPTQPCSWGFCMLNADQECPLEAPPIPEGETCPFICSAYSGVPGMEASCGGQDVLEVHAECARVFAPAVRMYDEDVPYIVNPGRRANGHEAGAAWFNFKCCEDVEVFEVEMDVLMEHGGVNSFFLYVDDQRQQFGWRQFSPDWQWVQPAMSWQVPAGCHNFIVDDREPGTKFRGIRLIGEAAEKCHFSAHTAEGLYEVAVGFQSGPGWDATGMFTKARHFVEEEETVFTPQDLALYGFAAVGASALMYYSIRVLLSRRKYSPINSEEHPQYGV